MLSKIIKNIPKGVRICEYNKMIDYKLIAVDMDGTLLTDNKEITPSTLKGINNLIKDNKIFCISTGRPFYGVKPYLDIIEGDIPLILYNGAIVTFSKTKKVLLSCNLTSDQSTKILDIINKYDGTFIFWSDEKLYVNKINDYTTKYFGISKAEPILLNEKIIIPHGNITKIIWFDENEKLVEYQKTVLKDFNDVNFFTSQPVFLEFVSQGISKAKAMEVIGNYYNINPSEMIAVGDGCNDIPMLEYAGLGVAMANASDDVKDNADYITLSNEEDGVLKVINEFMLRRR